MEDLILHKDSEEEPSEMMKVIIEAFIKHQELLDKHYKRFNPLIFLSGHQGIKINSKYTWNLIIDE